MKSRIVDGVNGLRMHVLEAGTPGRPCVLLLHGFPELAYSWRKVMPALADAGFHVVAPDQRGYGRTTRRDARYDGDLASFRILNSCATRWRFSPRSASDVACVVGPRLRLAGRGLVRADPARRFPLGGADERAVRRPAVGASRAVAESTPRSRAPRPEALPVVLHDARGRRATCTLPRRALHDFLRAYYHYKSADWKGNKPYPLECVERPTTGEAADVLRDGPRRGHGARPWRRRCRRRRDCRLRG